MSRTIRLRYTPKRHAWLQKLADEGTAQRDNLVGFHCMEFGWTEWAGEVGPTCNHERLTDAGRAILAAWNAAQEALR